jgi:uncharacterized protein (DUF362 family)
MSIDSQQRRIAFVTRRVSIIEQNGSPATAVQTALQDAGILDQLSRTTRVALKPNLTYPYYKRGVTTSPAIIRETVSVLSRYTDHIAIVETDGGYGAWEATASFEGHGLYDLQRDFGVEIVNLCGEKSEQIEFRSRGKLYRLPLPNRLLHETDLLISMPVPKIHCMTGLTLAYKNQWGCIPDIMRLRRHYIFNDAIVAINRALKPAVLADGTFFLDENGPMDGNAVRMDLIIAATDAGVFDRYVSEFMGWSWRRVPHLRRAVSLGDMPADLETFKFNQHPGKFRKREFRLNRTPRNWIALAGFQSRFLTWFGYESWFGRVVIHALLYAIAGKPVAPKPEAEVIHSPDSR